LLFTYSNPKIIYW